MRWKCSYCGFIFKRTGYTEICPQCWNSTMKGENDDEQYAKESHPKSDEGAQV